MGCRNLKDLRVWRDEEYDKAVAEKNLLYQKNVQRNTRATKEAFQNKRREFVKLATQKKRIFEKAHFEML